MGCSDVTQTTCHSQGLKFDVIPSRFEEVRVTSSRCPGSFALEMATGKALEVAHRICRVGLPAKAPATVT